MSAPARSAGELYVVATPIGNLEDLTGRARAVLADVDAVAAEDTRHTGALLRTLGISRPLVSLHEHNERDRVPGLIERICAGESIALVTDAGTPLVSDPGFELVRAAIARGVRVVPVPGASALLAALCVSGLPPDRFAFEGFLPARQGERKSRLQALREEPRTLVFYEAPHRLAAALADLASIFGAERPASVARELTKAFESVYRGPLGELAAQARTNADMCRGEIVVLVGGAPAAPSLAVDARQVLEVLLAELPPAQAAKLAARLTGASRAELYAAATELAGRRAPHQRR